MKRLLRTHRELLFGLAILLLIFLVVIPMMEAHDAHEAYLHSASK